jgi:hypothetical protein
MYRSLLDAELAIIPGTSHGTAARPRPLPVCPPPRRNREARDGRSTRAVRVGPVAFVTRRTGQILSDILKAWL